MTVSLVTFASYTYANGWRAYGGGVSIYGPPRVYKDPNGIVYLEGLVDKNGGSWIAGEAILQLPRGFWPQITTIAPAICYPAIAGEARMHCAGDVNPGCFCLGDFGGSSNPVGWMSVNIPPYLAAGV